MPPASSVVTDGTPRRVDARNVHEDFERLSGAVERGAELVKGFDAERARPTATDGGVGAIVALVIALGALRQLRLKLLHELGELVADAGVDAVGVEKWGGAAGGGRMSQKKRTRWGNTGSARRRGGRGSPCPGGLVGGEDAVADDVLASTLPPAPW